MSNPDVPLAAFGGWPLILLLAAAVVFVVSLCRVASLADERAAAFRSTDFDVIDPIVEHEGSLLGAWTFFDWQVDDPDLARA